MKHFMEKISILALSLMLVSTYAVSPVVPEMVSHFANQGYSEQQVTFLITVTSFAIMGALLANPVLTKFLSERAIVSLGLIGLALGGSLPVLVSSYVAIFLGRVVLGFSLGMINARAINLVGTHYSGREREQMMGLRGSSEVLGSASLTALVGGLLSFGWRWAFAIYLLAFVILGLYWCFVPKVQAALDQTEVPKRALSLTQWRQALMLALVAFFVINVNTALTLDIPMIVESSQLGTPAQASLVLSAMMLMGIVAGICFSPLVQVLKHWLLPASVGLFSTAVLLSSLTKTLLFLALAAMVSGFFYSIVLTQVFQTASEKTPAHSLNKVLTIILIGCNLGGATAAFVPDVLAHVNPFANNAYGAYAIVGFVLSIALILRSQKSSSAI